jgi:hypothetical protein
MDFAICLDQFSTNFDVNNLSSNGFSIYTDLDYTNPIASGIPYQDLFAPPIGNCPLIVDIPQGATQILVIDACATLPTNVAPIFGAGSSANSLITQCCYAIIPVPAQPISWCDTSGLEFDVFSSSYVGQIVAGNLISTLGTVTDYTIGWYLDGDYSAPVFMSGYGNAFLPYQHLHPLTGNFAVPSLAGDWEGIIHDIAINGVTYSSVSGSANGQPIPFESCFDTIVVAPLQCDNGSVSPSISKYSHQITFNSQAVGASPTPVSLTYALSPTTKYFAYIFQGYNVWDELEIKFTSGNPSATSNPSLYSQPIYLEKIKVGIDAPDTPGFTNQALTPQLPANYNSPYAPGGNFNGILNNVWPKSYNQTAAYQRTLTLTSLETSSNPSFPDQLEITITPNPTNNNTSWRAGFQCLEDFTCYECAFENYPNNLPKIWKIKLEKEYGCDKQRLELYLTSSCLNSDANLGSDFMGFSINTWNNTQAFIYPKEDLIGSISGPQSSLTTIPQTPISLTPQSTCGLAGPQPPSCGTPSTGTITVNKTFHQIQLTFNLESDYLFYKNYLISQHNNNFPVYTSPITCSPTSVSYYKWYHISIPVQGISVNCGDNSTYMGWWFHYNDYFNIIYNESPSTNTWSITIPQTPITACPPPQTACNSCPSVISLNTIYFNNLMDNPTPFTYTTNVGAKLSNPVQRAYIYQGGSGGFSGSYCFAGGLDYSRYPWYGTHTVPFISSSTGWVNLYSLQSNIPCIPSATGSHPIDAPAGKYGFRNLPRSIFNKL